MRPEVGKILGHFADGIVECVNFGTHIFKWDSEVNIKGDENLVYALNFRHALEIINSTNFLIRNSSVDPCKFLLRGLIETYFYFEFLFQRDTTERATIFLGSYYHNKLKFYRKFDPDSQQNKHLKKILTLDKSFDSFDFPEIPTIKEAIHNLEDLLLKNKYQPVVDEIYRLKNSGIKNPSWYRLFDGPKNLDEMAKLLELHAIYDVYYRGLSAIIHGVEIIDGKILKEEDGSASIMQIGYPNEVQTITGSLVTFIIRIFRLFIEKRIPQKQIEYHNWYDSIRPFYLQLMGEPLIISKKQL